MPSRTKKDSKRNHQSGGSRWQNFHFSGKLIVISVIFGLMLILIGGIVMAIGMDKDEDTKSDDYEDIQKKPPMAIVGPVIMGIGGFTVVVGVFMCLVETNVCRRRNVENSPLIEDEDRSKESAAIGIESDPTAIPSTSHKHRNGNHRKSPSPRKTRLNSKKPYSSKDRNRDATSKSPSSAPITVAGHSSKSFLSASDKFLTPPSSFPHEMHSNSRDAENQTSSSLMKSFTSSGNSWTVSTEFQTPNASSIENSMSLESSPIERMPGMLHPTALTINSHEFLTPKNSNAEMLILSVKDLDNQTQIVSENAISDDISASNGSASNDEAEIHHKEIKHKKISLNDVIVTASVEEDKEELENLDTEYYSPGSSTKDIGEPLLINESKAQIEDTESTPNTSENTEIKEINAEHYEGAPLNLVAENDLEDQNLVKKELDERGDYTKMPKTFEDGDRSESFNSVKVLLKESDSIISVPVEGTFSESQSKDTNAIQETGDSFQQENPSARESQKTEHKIYTDST